MQGLIFRSNRMATFLGASLSALVPACGGWELLFRLDFETRAHPRGAGIVFLEFVLDLHSGSEGRVGNLGHTAPCRDRVEVGPHVHRGSVHPRVALSAEGLHTLERLRASGDMVFKGDVYYSATEGAFPPDPMSDKIEVVISRDRWLDMLRAAGFRDVLVIEVPLPPSTDASAAARHLKEAEAHMRDGRWREAVGACRDALESVEKLQGDAKAAADALKSVAQNSRATSPEERQLALRKALHTVTHTARHVGQDPDKPYPWDREDAFGVISMTAAVIRWLT